MTAREIKIKTFSLIEELYPELDGLADDEDILKKINGIINSVIFELSRIKKIPTKYQYKVSKNTAKLALKDIPDFYQLIKIPSINYELIGDYEIGFILNGPDEETVDIYYYKLPSKMKLEFSNNENSDEYDKTFEFDLSEDVLEIAPYGIASDLLKNDMITNYGKYFNERYQTLKNELDTRITNSTAIIDGGLDI